MLSDSYRGVTHTSVSIGFKNFPLFDVVTNDLHFDPSLLTRFEQLVERKCLLFVVESLSDYTDKEFHEELANNDDQNDEVHNNDWVIVFYRLIVRLCGVHACKHHIDPTLGTLNAEESQQTAHSRVEIKIVSDPLTAVVVAVPHSNDVRCLLFHIKRKMVHLAC